MSEPRPVSDWLAEAAAALGAAGVEAPAREARLLLLHALARPAGALLDRRAVVAAPGLAGLVARRAAREPMALILGRQGFWTLELEVSPDTLIPRADSETLVEAALAALPAPGGGCCCSMATWGWPMSISNWAWCRRTISARCWPGGGAWRNAWCIIPAASTSWPGAPAPARWRGWTRAGWRRCWRRCGRWRAAMTTWCWISARALDGGADGLDAYRRIVAALPGLLAPGGVAVLELGIGQEASVPALARAAGLRVVALRPDLGGVARALVLAMG